MMIEDSQTYNHVFLVPLSGAWRHGGPVQFVLFPGVAPGG